MKASPSPLLVPFALASSAFLGACAGPAIFGPGGWDPAVQAQASPRDGARYRQAGDPESGAQPRAATGADVPLLGWDGGVVDAAPQGSVVDGRGPSHGIEPSTAGRMHIIELYQKVLDERDALRDEVEALTAALEKSQLDRAQVEHRRGELEARVSELEARIEELGAENVDMAARLTTAQIRRLEAEKLLLETRIAAHRSAQAEAGREGAERRMQGAEPGS